MYYELFVDERENNPEKKFGLKPSIFIGQTLEELISGYKYYRSKGDISKPLDINEIKKLEKIELYFSLPMSRNDYETIDIDKDLRININSETWKFFLKELEEIRSRRRLRGNLHKLVCDHIGLVFLPNVLANKLLEYDWKKIEPNMLKKHIENQKIYEELKSEGVLVETKEGKAIIIGSKEARQKVKGLYSRFISLFGN